MNSDKVSNKLLKKIKRHLFKNFILYVFAILTIAALISYQIALFLGYNIGLDSKSLSDISIAFFGAAGGSVTILIIEAYRNRLKSLIEINAAIAMFSQFINTFLNLKKQRIKPLSDSYYHEYKIYHSLESLKKTGFITPPGASLTLNFSTSKIVLPEIRFDVPLERIFSTREFGPQQIQILLQSKSSALDVKRICDEWDSLISIAQDLKQEDKLPFFLGLRKENGTTSTIFKDTIDNLVSRVDDGLWFSELTIKNLQNAARKISPFWLKDRIASAVLDLDHKELMPPADYKKGWIDKLNAEEVE